MIHWKCLYYWKDEFVVMDKQNSLDWIEIVFVMQNIVDANVVVVDQVV